MISIIIPTLNEESALPALLRRLSEMAGNFEIIVSDGISTDATVELANAAGVRLVTAPRGRGQQLAAGIAVAKGDVLWLLHADTMPGRESAVEIKKALSDPTVIGGNFRILFDGADDFSRWLEGFYAWFRRRGLYYGDSAVFIRRDTLKNIGGIRPVALMEDFDLTRRMERHGGTVCIEYPPVMSSSRRFAHRKPWRIFLQWLWIHALYYGRVSDRRMARAYRSEQHSPVISP